MIDFALRVVTEEISRVCDTSGSPTWVHRYHSYSDSCVYGTVIAVDTLRRLAWKNVLFIIILFFRSSAEQL